MADELIEGTDYEIQDESTCVKDSIIENYLPIKSLNNDTGSIHFVTIPPDVTVELNNSKIGITLPTQGEPTPVIGELFVINALPGNYEYRLSKTGFNTTIGQITVNAGVTTKIIELLGYVTEDAGGMYIFSAPLGAKVFINDVQPTIAGSPAITPILITDISPGEHSYRLTLDGFEDVVGTVKIIAGITASLNIMQIAIE